MSMRIDYTRPSITELEVEYAMDAARNGWGRKCYDYIYKFEDLFRDHIGVKYAVATSSCTGAYHLGLAALGIGEGDEVILADSNWIATVAPVIHLRAKPIFVDIDPVSWCICPKAVEKAITPKTRAILAVHLYGNPCEMGKLLSIGQKYQIPVIEDAAEAVGSMYRGQRVGGIGEFGVYSFHGTKTMTCGEGGMLVTNNQHIYEKAMVLNNHGRGLNEKKQFWSESIGYKYKISNIQAAIGCAQIERVDELVSRKIEILTNYKELFKDISELRLNEEQSGNVNGAWMVNAEFSKQSGVTRGKAINSLKENGIDGRVFFYPLSSMDMFEDRKENTNAWDISGRSVNLPSYHDMTLNDQQLVADIIKKIFNT